MNSTPGETPMSDPGIELGWVVLPPERATNRASARFRRGSGSVLHTAFFLFSSPVSTQHYINDCLSLIILPRHLNYHISSH